MFAIKFMVEDKALTGVLHALSDHGKLYNLEVVPVKNAATTNGSRRLVEKNTGPLRGQLLAALPSKFTTKEAAAMLADLGGKKESIYNALTSFVDQKAIKRDKNGEYTRLT